VFGNVLLDLLRFAEKLSLKEKREIGSRTERGSTIIIPGRTHAQLLFLRTESQSSGFSPKI
jgi:hypothetical protein